MLSPVQLFGCSEFDWMDITGKLPSDGTLLGNKLNQNLPSKTRNDQKPKQYFVFVPSHFQASWCWVWSLVQEILNFRPKFLVQEIKCLFETFWGNHVRVSQTKICTFILKGILSWSANFLYVKRLILLSSETYFLSKFEAPFPSQSGKTQNSWYQQCTEKWLREE